MSPLEQILLEHGIKATSNRIIVLNALRACDRPVTMQGLTDRIESLDKSNVFRTLSLFREHGLVHTIEACDEGLMYELCHAAADAEDIDIHPHFHCVVCHEVYCLKGVRIPRLDYPEGFDVREESFVVSGVCPNCKSKL